MNEYSSSLWNGNIEKCAPVQIGKSWVFVGRVPVELAYSKLNGEIPTEEEVAQIQRACLPALEKKRLGIIDRRFPTKEDAILALESVSERGA